MLGAASLAKARHSPNSYPFSFNIAVLSVLARSICYEEALGGMRMKANDIGTP
jgi:hypothetical protein